MKKSVIWKFSMGIGVILILILSLFAVLNVVPSVYSKDFKDFNWHEGSKIDKKVFDKFDDVRNIENDSKIRVIVQIKDFEKEKSLVLNLADKKKLKEDAKKKVIDSVDKEGKKLKRTFDKDVVFEIPYEDLDLFEQNNNVEKVILDEKVGAFLQDSVPLINASGVWNVQINDINMTGIDETICIIDTGVNYGHSDLGGCSFENFSSGNCKVVGGYDFVNDDNDPMDDHGHGTHVAGIAAANGGIKGVAVDAKIAAVKVLDYSGSGYLSDVKAGIDWCINNSQIYNISVISLSLGSGSYSDYCNEDYLIDSINLAISENISVIAATGNDGSTTQIASPACIQNVTSVGATSKTGAIASYSSRNRITDLFAPGGISSGKINSTFYSGGYFGAYGTSMAAPHVSGAFVLARQFFITQYGRVPTPLELQDIFNLTGIKTADTASGLNFSRIDVYSAIVSIDNSSPFVSLIEPNNSAFNSQGSFNFKCSAYDYFGIKNVSLIIWNSTGMYYSNFSNSIINLTVSNFNSGGYNWNCLAYDSGDNVAYAYNNYTFYVGNVSSNLEFPANNAFVNYSNNEFNCLSQSSFFELSNVTFYLWDSSRNLIKNETKNISGILNNSNFSYNLSSDGFYYWNCNSFNNASQNALAVVNYTLIYKTSIVTISNVVSSVSATSAVINWTTSENASSRINYGNSISLGTSASNPGNVILHSIFINGLSASTKYYYNVTSCDIYNVCTINGAFDFTTLVASQNTNSDSSSQQSTSTSSSSSQTIATATGLTSSETTFQTDSPTISEENNSEIISNTTVGSSLSAKAISDTSKKQKITIGRNEKIAFGFLAVIGVFFVFFNLIKKGFVKRVRGH